MSIIVVRLVGFVLNKMREMVLIMGYNFIVMISVKVLLGIIKEKNSGLVVLLLICKLRRKVFFLIMKVSEVVGGIMKLVIV